MTTFPAATLTDTGFTFPARLTSSEVQKATGVETPFRVVIDARWGDKWTPVVLLSSDQRSTRYAVERICQLRYTVGKVGRKTVYNFRCTPPAEIRHRVL